MAVHYKFNAAKEYDTLPVDGLHISLADLKDSIIHSKRLGRGDLCDLQVTNAETKETYTDDKALIPKNSSLIIARVPIDPSQRKFGDLSRDDKELLLSNPEYRMNTEGAEEAEQLSRKLEEVPDLTKFVGTEEEKISAMIAQSTLDYHPSRYLKLRNTVMSGKVPPFYKCYKCHQGGHWVTSCPLNNQDLRKSTGIPSKFLMEVDDPNTPGVMITGVGKYVVFRQNLVMGEGTQAKVRPKCSEKPPDELVCLLCKEMMQDAVLTPCCANAYCDECIRNHLLDSDDHACPSCREKGVSPDTLVPNRYLRLKILQFGNQFLTELPEDENGRSESPPLLPISKSRSYPGTPVTHMSPVASPKSVKMDSPKPRVVSPLKTPPRRSPPVLADVRIMEEEEEEKRREMECESKKLKEARKMCEDKEEENLQETLVEAERGKEIGEEVERKEEEEMERPKEVAEGMLQDDLVCRSPASHVMEDSESGSPVKGRKHGKKSKKKKEGEGKEKKHKKKDKEKKKNKKRKDSKEGLSEGEADGGHSTSVDEGQEKPSDTLMNEAICPTFDPSVPPPGTMPLAPGLPSGYTVVSVIPPHQRHYPPLHHHSGIITHPGGYGIQSQEEDPYTTFMRYLEQKDERKRKRLRSKSSSRSPPSYRDRSRPRLQPMQSYSRSRSRSISKTGSPSWSRKHHSGGSPRPRRRYSPSPPSSSRHGYRSISRDRSPSLSRSPSPGRRLKSSPLSSGHLYNSYSPHRMGIEKPRDKNLYNSASNYSEHPTCNSYGYNSKPVYDAPLPMVGYGAGRYSGERAPPRDSRRSRRYAYELGMEMAPQGAIFKEESRRLDARRMLEERRAYEERSLSREDDWRRHRNEEEDWGRRNHHSKGERRPHHYENRRATPPPDGHKGRGRECETSKESLHSDGRHRREPPPQPPPHKNGSPSPPPREERKRERREKGRKASRERIVTEEEERTVEVTTAKEKARKEKRKSAEKEKKRSAEKDRVGRERVTRWGEEKAGAKDIEPLTPKEDKTTPPPEAEAAPDREEKEKKKHEKKKKKKEKRRASQASQEGMGISDGAAEEDEKKGKKREKERRKLKKGQEGEELGKEKAEADDWHPEVHPQSVPGTQEPPLVVNPDSVEVSQRGDRDMEVEVAFMPALSKWEREDDESPSPVKGAGDLEKKVEESLVTSDVIKRAENALFSKGLVNRTLMPRKVYLEKSSRERERELQQQLLQQQQQQQQQQQEDTEEGEEVQRSPTPEWERGDTREAKRKGGSIQITISSKTESQIGRPRVGKFEGLKGRLSPTFEEALVSKGGVESEKKALPSEGKAGGRFSRWEGAISPGAISSGASSPKKREHSSSNGVKAKKLRVDSKDSMKRSEKRSGDVAEETSCSSSSASREHTHKEIDSVVRQEATQSKCDQEMRDVELHSYSKERMSQEQVVSSTEEIKMATEGDSQTIVSPNSGEFVSQSMSSQTDDAVSNTSLCTNVCVSTVPLSGPASSNEKDYGSELEEGELVEEQPSEALPDSTEGQLSMETKAYLGPTPFKEDFKLLQQADKPTEATQRETETVMDVAFGPGQEGSLLLSPPSPTFKRKVKEENPKEKKPKKKKRRKRSSSSSSTSSSSSSSSSSDSSSEDDEESKKKKKKRKKRKKKKVAADSESSDDEGSLKGTKKKKKKKDKKRKKKKREKRKERKEKEKEKEKTLDKEREKVKVF